MKKQTNENDEMNLIETSVLNYLRGKREKAFLTLSKNLQEYDFEEIKAILKQELYTYMRQQGGREGRVEHYAPFYKMIKNFNASDFIKREWKYVPYYIRDDEYRKMQSTCKYHVKFKRYNYEKPLYDFANSVTFADSKSKYEINQEQVKTDIRFYAGHHPNQGQSMYAKLVNLKFKPVSLKLLRDEIDAHPDIDKDAILLDKFLYTRSLSISMYALLDANPNAAMPIMRYDNDIVPHHNVFLGDDPRRVVFGDTASAPHFHFQNEEDSLLCLRKFKTNEGKIKYRTGRCNAIDCPHLKQYLKKLDKLNKGQLQRNLQEHNDFGMPFLVMKARSRNNENLFQDPENLIREYLSTQDLRCGRDIKKWFDRASELHLYENEPNRIFTNLIKSLDLLEFVTSKEKVCTDLKEGKVLSDIEVLLANDLVNEMNLLIDTPKTEQTIDDNYYPQLEE